MATLTVWRFKDADGAERAAAPLADLQSQSLMAVHDAATVSRPAGRKRPRTRQLHNPAGAGALSGSFCAEKPHLIHTNLSTGEETRLREYFAEV